MGFDVYDVWFVIECCFCSCLMFGSFVLLLMSVRFLICCILFLVGEGEDVLG